MFPSNITLVSASSEDIEFKQISIDSSGSVRLDDLSTNVEPRKMVIRHSVSTPKGSSVPVDRHLVQFTKTKVDEQGSPQTAIVNMTIAVPRSGAIDSDDVENLLVFSLGFLSVGDNLSGLLLGEY
jgi:selenocysteine lyase/cysteine desulfurase